MKKGKNNYFLNIILILLISGATIYFTMGKSLGKSINAILKADYTYILLALGLMIIYFILDGWNLYIFGKLKKKTYTYKQGFINAISGIFFNGITPFSSGGQFAQVYIFNRQGINPTNSASILLMAFIVYQTVLVFFTAVILLFTFSYYTRIYSGFYSLVFLGFIINFIVISGLFLGARSKRFQNFITNNLLKILAKIHIVKDYEGTKFKMITHLHNFRKELNVLLKNKTVLLKSTIFNFGKLILIYATPYFCALAIGMHLDFKYLIIFIQISSFIFMITAFVPIPGASGGSEGAFLLLFAPFLNSVQLTTVLLIWRFITYYFGLLLGGFIFATNREINSRSE